MEAATVERPDRRFWGAFALCAAASLVPLWSVKYLPMVDLPQHAAQVSAWLHLDDPAMGFGEQFELHPFTPYVVPYLVAMAFVRWAGLVAALKIVVTASVLGLPLVTYRLIRRRGGDPWWSLWGFPLSFGVSFYWGFLSYIAAVPLGILFVDVGDAYAREPTRRRGILLAAFGSALFFIHIHVLVVGLAIVVLLVALRAPDRGRALLRLTPLGAPLAVMVAWVLSMAAHDQRTQAWEWHFTWVRLTMLPQFLFDAPHAWDLVEPDVDHGAAAMTLSLVVATTLARPRPSRTIADWAPLAVVAAIFLFCPWKAFGSFFVSDRFALLVVPFLFAAVRPCADERGRRASRALAVVAIVAWMGVLTTRFARFDDQDMAPFDRVVRQMEPNRRVVALVFGSRTESNRGIPLLVHAGAWAQAEKGGVFATSFASLFNLPIRYRPGREPRHTDQLEWDPTAFVWDVDGWADYFLVMSAKDPAKVFAGATEPVALIARDGDWWLYRHLPGAGSLPATASPRPATQPLRPGGS